MVYISSVWIIEIGVILRKIRNLIFSNRKSTINIDIYIYIYIYNFLIEKIVLEISASIPASSKIPLSFLSISNY